MSTATTLFRFVQLRRSPPPASPTLPLPPPGGIPPAVFDMRQNVPPEVIDTIQARDQAHARLLSHALLERMPPEVRAAGGATRAALRWVSVDDTVTLDVVRHRLSEPAGLMTSPAFAELTGRAAGVVVLDRWLGLSRSPGGARASALLRGVVVVRLAASRLDGGYRLADLVRGATILLPDLRRPIGGPSAAVAALRDASDALPRLSARALAAGLGDNPSVAAVTAAQWGDLAPAAHAVAAVADTLAVPATATLSSLGDVLGVELGGASGADLAGASWQSTSTGVLTNHLADELGVELPPPALPTLEARARVLGRGDLMLVRTEHLRYELAEIAYVENVLRSEVRGRVVVVDTATSERIVETSNLFSETSQELTTTERFGLQQAAEQSSSSTTSLSAGVSVAGGIGPVSVGLDLNASHSTSDSASSSSASSYAKDVTDKATDTLRSSASSTTVTTNRSRFTETDNHSFDNSAGVDHVRGLYRWLNKVDRAQLYNYGERLMLEFVVPEPAAQHVYLAGVTTVAGAPIPPPPFNLRAHDITEHTYVSLGAPYDTAGLTRPPDKELSVPVEFTVAPAQPQHFPPSSAEKKEADTTTPQPDHNNDAQTQEVSIPEGYAALRVVATVVYGGHYAYGPPPVDLPTIPGSDFSPSFPPVMIGAGGQRVTVHFNDRDDDNQPVQSRVIDLEGTPTGNLPVAVGSQQSEGLAVTLRVICERTPEAYAAWQLATYQLIQQAYLGKQSAYQSALALSQVQQGYAAITPEDVNRDVERRELKRGCQTILSGQDFDLFGSLDLPAGEIPRLDVDESWLEADVIQFFEDVFDWDLMIYLFYPYQWAGRLRWAELLSRTSGDPLHQAFLQAGAARVVVPVREGFERAVAAYLRDGEVPVWGPLPWRGKPTGYPPVDELVAEADQRPADEVAVDDPWEVVSPTTLIYLQEDAELNPAPDGSAPARITRSNAGAVSSRAGAEAPGAHLDAASKARRSSRSA